MALKDPLIQLGYDRMILCIIGYSYTPSKQYGVGVDHVDHTIGGLTDVCCQDPPSRGDFSSFSFSLTFHLLVYCHSSVIDPLLICRCLAEPDPNIRFDQQSHSARNCWILTSLWARAGTCMHHRSSHRPGVSSRFITMT